MHEDESIRLVGDLGKGKHAFASLEFMSLTQVPV